MFPSKSPVAVYTCVHKDSEFWFAQSEACMELCVVYGVCGGGRGGQRLALISSPAGGGGDAPAVWIIGGPHLFGADSVYKLQTANLLCTGTPCRPTLSGGGGGGASSVTFGRPAGLRAALLPAGHSGPDGSWAPPSSRPWSDGQRLLPTGLSKPHPEAFSWPTTHESQTQHGQQCGPQAMNNTTL